MTWDEAVSNRYRHLSRDLGYSVDVDRRTIELSPETQRMFKTYAVEVEPSTDVMPKVTFTTSIKDPYENIANCFGNVVDADWIKRKLEESIDNLRKENEIMTNEIRRKDIPVDLGRHDTDVDIHGFGWPEAIFHPEYVIIPAYERIIFNNPATIILWKDGTKTVVKCGPNDVYDPEKGLAMCLLKKLCGNDGIMFHRTIRKMMESYEPPVGESESLTDTINRLKEKFKEMSGKND